jgi:UDP-4-amino-4-deoxy-L-arabinose-oxoglutarate aminotransferase
MKLIPHSRPWFTNQDSIALAKTLQSYMVGQGDSVRNLELSLAKWIDADDAVAVSSCGAAIVLALRSLNVDKGDEVILPTYVCRTLLEAVLTVGAKPVLCDVGEDWVVTIDDVKRVLSRRTAALIIPHIYGIYADVRSFRAFGRPIIEDYSQALDAKFHRVIEGDIAVVSLHATKCVTAGEGGVALSGDPRIIDTMRSYRDGLGTSCSKRFFAPLSDLASALVLSQLDRYDLSLLRRREIANSYIEILSAVSPHFLSSRMLSNSMFFRFPIKIPGGLSNFEGFFAKRGIKITKGVDQLLHRLVRLPDADFPCAVRHFVTTISLPIYPALTDAEKLRCESALKDVLKNGYAAKALF